MRRLRERPDKHYRGERCTSRLNSHGTVTAWPSEGNMGCPVNGQAPVGFAQAVHVNSHIGSHRVVSRPGEQPEWSEVLHLTDLINPQRPSMPNQAGRVGWRELK